MKTINIQTKQHSELVDITDLVSSHIPHKISGIAIIYVPHTSAGIMINEGADPNVQTDILQFLEDQIPWDYTKFKHNEGNSAAHIKAMLVGNSQTVIIDNGELMLGTWERLFFCEFDGPRKRKTWITIISQHIDIKE